MTWLTMERLTDFRRASATLRILATVVCLVAPALTSAQGAAETQIAPTATQDEVRGWIAAGDFARAEAAARQRLEDATKLHGERSLEVAEELRLVVDVLIKARRPGPEAQQFAERALSIKEELLGPQHADLAPLLRQLATLAVLSGAPDRAQTALHRELSIVESAPQPDAVGLATVLMALGEVSDNVRDPEAALAYFERAVQVATEGLPADHATTTFAMNRIGMYLQERGRYEDSIRWLLRGLEATERRLGAEHLEVAAGLTWLAASHYRLGNFSEALPLYERALAIRQRGNATPDVIASSLSNLALVKTGTLELNEAKVLYQQALDILQGIAPTFSLANTLSNFGLLLYQMADYHAAIPTLRRSVAVAEDLGGPDNLRVAQALTLLGMTERSAGFYAEARRSYERALEIREAQLAEDHPDVARTLLGLSILLMFVGDNEAAMSLFDHPAMQATLAKCTPVNRDYWVHRAELTAQLGSLSEAIAMLEKTLAELKQDPEFSDRQEHLLWLRIAGFYEQHGDIEAALRCVRKGLEIQRVLQPGEPHQLGDTLRLAARLELKAGDFAAAQASVDEAIEVLESVLEPDHPGISETYQIRSLILAAVGETEAALAAALQAEQSGRGHLENTLNALAERQALRFAAIRPTGLNTALTLASLGLPASALRATWDAVIRSRAFVLDEMASRRRAVTGANEIADLAHELADAKQRLANLLVRDLAGIESQSSARELEAARLRKEAAERALSDQEVGFRDELLRRRASLDDVARALPRDAALLAFMVYQRVATPNDATSTADDKRNYLAFVLSGQFADPIAVPLGSAAEIERLVYEWRSDVTTFGAGAGDPSRSSGDRLRRVLWDPVAAHLEGIDRVFVVPEGALHLVNFAALPVGESQFLVETGPLLHVLSAERDLVHPKRTTVSGAGMLALGGPDYDASIAVPQAPNPSTPAESTQVVVALRASRPDCEGFNSLQFSPLPGTLREAEDLARLWESRLRVSGSAAADPVSRLIGAAAGEGALKTAVAGKRVLHLATHGFVLTGTCMRSAATSRGMLLGTADRQPTPVNMEENPLLLSGLALAGANRHATTGDLADDGILTAEEVASLDLSGVEWAVLSACDTGIGDVQVGEGVLGLRRAFEIAGARTVIMSLWSVEDEATRAWMHALYEARFLRGADTAQAVQLATRQILNTRRSQGLSTHPFSWGAFVAAGDWR